MDDAELRLRVGVTHLMSSYQYFADTGRIESLAGLFLPDGVLELDGISHRGADDILAFFLSTAGRFADVDFLPARHHLSSIYVEPLPDGSAKTYACFQFIGTHGLDHWGTYRDVAVERAAGWRFQRRRVITEGFAATSRLGPPSAR